MIIAAYIFMGIGVFFALTGVVGILRFPDSFSRMQASTCIPTLGVLGVIIGAVLYMLGEYNSIDISMIVKLCVLGVFYIVTNPISGHAIARAAYRKGIRPEKALKYDKYGEDLENDD